MTEPPQNRGLAGEALAARREELKMTLAQVASALLLSQRHVEALEANEPSAFYNHNFYDQAKRRYAVLLGLADAEAASAAAAAYVARPPPPEPAQPPRKVHSAPAPRPALPLRSLALALLAAAAGVYAVSQGGALLESMRGALSTAPLATAPETLEQDTLSSGPAPAAPVDPPPAPQEGSAGGGPPTDASPPADAPLAEPAGDAKSPATTAQNATDAEAAFLFEAQRLCWVFARQTSGKETKVTLKAGQLLALPAQLSYLAVGDLSAVRIVVDGDARDLSAFSSDGRVARLGPAELRALRAGSTPASANSAPEASDVEVGHP